MRGPREEPTIEVQTFVRCEVWFRLVSGCAFVDEFGRELTSPTMNSEEESSDRRPVIKQDGQELILVSNNFFQANFHSFILRNKQL